VCGARARAQRDGGEEEEEREEKRGARSVLLVLVRVKSFLAHTHTIL
jgi:hypothetical protein